MPLEPAVSASRAAFPRFTAALGLLVMAACSVLGAPSKVRAGELYVPGSARYDAYFGEVHAQQVAADAWPNDRKSARKPLLDTLKLAPETDDIAIMQSTKDRLSAGVLRLEVSGTDVHIVEAVAARHDGPRDILAALEETAHAEIARASKLAEVPAHVDALAKTGLELETHIAEDFAGDGQKPFDVREELHASYDVLAAIAGAAQRERHVADQFVAELGRAVATGSEVPVVATTKTKPIIGPAKPELPAKPAPKPASKPAPPPPVAPAARPEPRSEPVAAAPKPPPPPAPKPAAKSSADEVFNP
jgi:hypothetical protein